MRIVMVVAVAYWSSVVIFVLVLTVSGSANLSLLLYIFELHLRDMRIE